MKNRLFILLSLLCVLFASCKKSHYDMGNAHGVSANGEMLLPLAKQSLTMMDMMQRFEIDSLIECNENGSMKYNYVYEHFGAVQGRELLKFNDLNYQEHFEFENPFPVALPFAIDTMLHFDHAIEFEADHIRVFEALMRSGRFDFGFETNIGQLRRVVIRSSDIKDAAGHSLELDFQVNAGGIGFDLGGWHYDTETENTLHLDYDLYFRVQGTTDPELFFNVDIEGRELVIQEMRGFVETYASHNVVDTAFNLFPGNIAGSLEVKGARLRLSERNTFGLSARLEVDTALVSGEGFAPYSILEALPLAVNLPVQNGFAEVFNHSLNGRLNASSSRAYAVSDFIVNPEGFSEVVSVADTCNIDVRVDVSIPFAFAVSDVHYLDTVKMDLSEIDFPDMIERITLDLTFNSTIPMNLGGKFYLYDSENDVITDILLEDDEIIKASFDGQPAVSSLSVDITDDRVAHFMSSDRIIMFYELDTDSRDVEINANQSLGAFIKAKVKYNGVVEIN